jgi:hypothetical protein
MRRSRTTSKILEAELVPKMDHPSDVEQRQIAKAFLCDDATDHLGTYVAYFDFYNSVFCPYTPHEMAIQIDNPAFASHADIVRYYEILKEDPTVTRSQLRSSFSEPNVLEKEKENAIRAVVKVAFMLDCASKDSHSEGFHVGGYAPLKWEEDERFVDFVARAFPAQAVPPASSPPAGKSKILEAQMRERSLKAWKLKERYKIRFEGTDNIADHLLYDEETRTVKVFHHTAFLKAHLVRSSQEQVDLDITDSIEL